MNTLSRSLSLLSLVVVAACSASDDGATNDDDFGDESVQAETSEALSAANLPKPGSLKTPIEGYATYDSKLDQISHCGGAQKDLKSGPKRLVAYLAKYGITANSYYACQTGFHPVGQALDVFMKGTSAMQSFADWLTANKGEMARRLGLVQIIWNRKMWRSYNSGSGRPQGAWGVYNGSDPHTSHVHISFGSAGAAGTTSFFTQVVK
jgi:hypothetical protein